MRVSGLLTKRDHGQVASLQVALKGCTIRGLSCAKIVLIRNSIDLAIVLFKRCGVCGIRVHGLYVLCFGHVLRTGLQRRGK